MNNAMKSLKQNVRGHIWKVEGAVGGWVTGVLGGELGSGSDMSAETRVVPRCSLVKDLGEEPSWQKEQQVQRWE